MNAKANPEKIRKLRTARGLSQEQLAERAKIGHRTVQRLEDAHAVRASTLAAVASALGVDVSHITSPVRFGASFADERRAVELRIAELLATGTARPDNAKYRVEVLEVAPPRDDEDLFTPPVVTELAQRLRQLGFRTSIGTWDSARLLAKVEPETEDTIYVLHAANESLAARVCDIIQTLGFGLGVAVLDSSEVSAKSDNISRESVTEYSDLLVAYRAAG